MTFESSQKIPAANTGSGTNVVTSVSATGVPADVAPRRCDISATVGPIDAGDWALAHPTNRVRTLVLDLRMVESLDEHICGTIDDTGSNAAATQAGCSVGSVSLASTLTFNCIDGAVE